LRDNSDAAIATTVTAGDGSYLFDNVPVGSYSIVQTQPPGYGSSTPNTLAVNLSPAGLSGQNFGESTGSLSGRIYYDANNNGAFDGSDFGLVSVAVTLIGTDVYGNPVTRTTTTAADGTYVITGLVAGTHTLTEAQPAAVPRGAA